MRTTSSSDWTWPADQMSALSWRGALCSKVRQVNKFEQVSSLGTDVEVED